MLRARVDVTLGDFDLDIDLNARAGRVTAVLGPNGAGKTTLLRCIAGTVALDAGRIELDGTVLDEPPSTLVAPQRRRIGEVHQDYLLFPHLSALENVAFGPRSAGLHRVAARAVARRWLARVGLADFAEARPRTLSGGQAQRVALARALACDPAVLLLDEPLAALDAGSRPQVRRDLARFLDEYAGVTILVTHDPADAFALADDVVVLERGRVVQAGELGDVMASASSAYLRDFVAGATAPTRA